MQSFHRNLLCANATYGFVRGLAKTNQATVREYNYGLSWQERPIRNTERAYAVVVSTAIAATHAPVLLLCDIYKLEAYAHGYNLPVYNCLDLVI